MFTLFNIDLFDNPCHGWPCTSLRIFMASRINMEFTGCYPITLLNHHLSEWFPESLPAPSACQDVAHCFRFLNFGSKAGGINGTSNLQLLHGRFRNSYYLLCIYLACSYVLAKMVESRVSWLAYPHSSPLKPQGHVRVTSWFRRVR